MTAQREWFEKDYYAVLGVPKGATDKEISRAFKKLAKEHHPDANQGNPAAEERFKEISAAYDVLGDATKRSEYDEVRQMVASGVGPDGAGGFGPGGFGGGGGAGGRTFRFDTDGGGLGDIFGNLFGGGGSGRRRARGATGPQRGRDLETELHLQFDDAIRGVTSTVRFRAEASCSTCAGSGAAPGTMPETCPECHGAGTIADNQGPFSFSQVCPTCGGRGQIIPSPCPTCGGRGVEVRAREVKVRIPAGVADAQRIRVKGRGGAGANGGPPGDLFVIVHVRGHALFGRSGNDLTLHLPVSFPEAALGADIKVPTLDSTVTVRIPPGTPSGKVLRVRGKGVAADGNGKAGDLLVTVDVQVPVDLTSAQREAIEALAVVLDDDPRAALFADAQDRRKREEDS
ncbi:MAG TPA: molecular chaperone DnaJ [Acidimicrobiia bacterium]|nr:molecular chaperone DnaJ [Acidimicrobiia bacterium]